jgi:LemA protein
MLLGIILIGIFVFAVFYIVTTHNVFQALKTQIAASIQEIGNQLKRQASLIPNLEAAVKAYMGHEKGIFTMLTDARKSLAQADSTHSAKDINDAIDKIQAIAPKISIAVEANPELKADGTVTQFMNELTDTADKLMYSRRSLIDLTQAYNQKLVVFPSNLIAKLFDFKPEQGLGVAMSGSHLEVSPAEMSDVKVSL